MSEEGDCSEDRTDYSQCSPQPGQSMQDCCDEVQLARSFKALSHPVRLMILASLSRQDGCCCGDICSNVPLAQSTVSQHLKVLKEAGFLEFESSGLKSHYRLNRDQLRWMRRACDAFVSGLGMEPDLTRANGSKINSS